MFDIDVEIRGGVLMFLIFFLKLFRQIISIFFLNLAMINLIGFWFGHPVIFFGLGYGTMNSGIIG